MSKRKSSEVVLTDDQKVSFGARLREVRMETGLSQAGFAKTLNVTDVTICTAENGKTQPSGYLIDKICETYKVQSSWLMYGIGLKRIEAQTDDELIEQVMTGSDEQLKAVIRGIVKSPGGWDSLKAVMMSIKAELDKLDE